MTIFTPINIKPTGGTSTFARKFQRSASQHGHEIIFKYQSNYDALFVITSCPLRYIIDARLKQKPVIHRLDGVYYPNTVAGRLAPIYNLKPKLIHRYASTYTIYQSIYSKYCAKKFFGPPHSKQQEVVYNGVDVTHFTPTCPQKNLRDNPNQHVFITWSRFRRPDQILPLIEAIEHYRQHHHKNVKLVALGNFEGEVQDIPNKYLNHAHLSFPGLIPNQDLPSYARGADVFVLTHQNPPCPNNVLEAMSSGLPICGVNDGAMSEITIPGENSELIPTQGDAFYHPRQLDIPAFTANMNKIMKNQNHYSKNSRSQIIRDFQLENMTKEYLNIITIK